MAGLGLFTVHRLLFTATMCHYVFLASPLTLSEIRSMLPAGITGDLATGPDHRSLKDRLPDAQTIARLLHGNCSCDFVTQRIPVPREDEGRLRVRYRALGLSREVTIGALDRHRAALLLRPQPPGHWPSAFAGFVAEHARNAGPSLYCLHFSHDGRPPIVPHSLPIRTLTARQVREAPAAWLSEERLTLVGP